MTKKICSFCGRSEKDVKLLDFGGQRRFFQRASVQKFVCRCIGFSDFHDVNTIFGSGGNLNNLPADIFAGAVKFMPFEGGDDKHLDSFPPHTQPHQLHRKGFSGSAGSQNRHICVLVNFRVENIDNNKGIIDFIGSKKDTVVVTEFKGSERIAACCSRGQHVSFGTSIQMLFQICQRERRQNRLFFPERAGTDVQIL